MNDLKIWKMIFEIRYPAAPLFFDARGQIASKWQWTSDLTEWRIANNSVAVYNKSNTTVLNIEFKRLAIVMELPKSQSAFCDQACEFSSWALDTLQVKTVDRIGLRFLQIAPRQHFKLLVSKMREKLLGLKDDDWAILGGEPEDMAIPLTLVLNENKANFNLGPMRQDELVEHFQADDVKKKLPNVGLFLDFDLYQENPHLSLESRNKKIGDFLKSGTQQIIEISNKFMDKHGAFK